MKRILRLAARLVGTAVLLAAAALAAARIREWRPAPVETLYAAEDEPRDTLRRGDTLRVLSWNIGYAGLGNDMDFFYDGGSRTRDSRERTLQNLRSIVDYLRRRADEGVDLILLQEVDLRSRRSWKTDQFDSVASALKEYAGWHALNYKCDFVPVPVTDPLGRVESGIAAFSRLRPSRVVRYSYPGGFTFPTRMFNLKRCLLSVEFPLLDSTGKTETLYVQNTHNTAYDTGGMRAGELAFLNGYLADKPFAVTAGDWNCNPPGYVPTPDALQNDRFNPLPIDRNDFPDDMTFVYDPSTPSNRYGYEPYRPETTTTTLLDFALCGAGIEPVAFETVDLGFKNSDHNPVTAVFVIR